MADKTKLDILFKSQKSGDISQALMEVFTYSDKEQKVRAIKSLLVFWMIALVCVLIPVAHFILVPTFFITGIISASRKWNKAQEGTFAEGNCPACQKHIQINLEKSADLPQWHHCPECDEALELQQP